MSRTAARLLPLILVAVLAGSVSADSIVLLVEGAPEGGLAVVPVDLGPAAQWCKLPALESGTLQASAEPGGRDVPVQFVPESDGATRGTLLLALPQGVQRVRLRADPTGAADAPAWDGWIRSEHYAVQHGTPGQPGLPTCIQWPGSGKVAESIRWNDRLYDRPTGAYGFVPESQSLVSRGPLADVVRVAGRFQQGDRQPASHPEAVYHWFYFRGQPRVGVTARFVQAEPFEWSEAHFLELLVGSRFPGWGGGDPAARGDFVHDEKSHRFGRYGAVVDGRDAIGMVRAGTVLVYDGPGDYQYLHAQGDNAWQPWNSLTQSLSAWLWLGSADDPLAAVAGADAGLAPGTRITVTTEDLSAQIAAASGATWSQRALARHWERQGKFEAALAALSGAVPEGSQAVLGGDLGTLITQTEGGYRLAAMEDTARNRPLLASEGVPLFSVTLRHAETGREVVLSADAGWESVEAASPLTLRWSRPAATELGDLAVALRGTAVPETSRVAWHLEVGGQASPWSLIRVVFPQVALAQPLHAARLFFPRGPGEVAALAGQAGFSYGGRYPNGWTSMPYFALYDDAGSGGLYLGMHDPLGSTKELRASLRPADGAVALAFEHPVPDMGRPGNRFELPGEAVFQLFRGDWFDAARIYRDWVRREARWFPPLGPDGRSDTPLAMRELCVWGLSNGTAAEVVPGMKRLREYLGVPAAVHWYNWHEIPFDNDYPHYFPTRPGFAEGVRDLELAGVATMPYINGRLWDTRDRGAEDGAFTSVARPAATKDEQGEPIVETYGSKESDGSPVRLAVMCPATQLWQTRQREIVLRLMQECGVRGVYMDQIAAAQPALCCDPSHGHPLGGGHWWTESYWRLLESIRQAMPQDRFLTTECNGEPYIRWFDGYLTWHWQFDDQVPAFPAIYGGSIQMFGRAYRGGPTAALALRMKAGQQLLYGEQLGWLGPDQVLDKPEGAFFRQMVTVRHQFRRYFYAGEMVRPPRLVGDVPQVTADWQWSGEWPVTDPALQAGVWRLPREGRLLVVVVNVSDSPISARLQYDTAEWLAGSPSLVAVPFTPDGAGEAQAWSPRIDLPLTVPPATAWAWEIRKE